MTRRHPPLDAAQRRIATSGLPVSQGLIPLELRPRIWTGRDTGLWKSQSANLVEIDLLRLTFARDSAPMPRRRTAPSISGRMPPGLATPWPSVTPSRRLTRSIPRRLLRSTIQRRHLPEGVVAQQPLLRQRPPVHSERPRRLLPTTVVVRPLVPSSAV